MKTFENVTLELDARKLLVQLGVALVFLHLLFFISDALFNYYFLEWKDSLGALGPVLTDRPIRRIFNIAREDSIPSWVVTIITLAVGITAFLIARIKSVIFEKKSRKRAWYLVALIFVYLALDDAAEIHERLGTVTDNLLNFDPNLGRVQADEITFFQSIRNLFPSYGWQFLLLPLFGIFGVYLLLFFFAELSKREFVVIFLSICSLSLAIGIDFIEGLPRGHWLNLHVAIEHTFNLNDYGVRHFSKTIEETIESLAMSAILLTLLHHLLSVSKSIILDLQGHSKRR